MIRYQTFTREHTKKITLDCRTWASKDRIGSRKHRSRFVVNKVYAATWRGDWHDPASGLCLPADLQAGDFLAFELNIVPESLIDEDVSYIILGVEFFATLPGDSVVQHATVFKSIEDIDCDFATAAVTKPLSLAGLNAQGKS